MPPAGVRRRRQSSRGLAPARRPLRRYEIGGSTGENAGLPRLPPVVRPSCDGKQSRVLAPSNGTSPSARRATARPGRLRVVQTSPASEKRTRAVTVRTERGSQAAVFFLFVSRKRNKQTNKQNTDTFRPQIRRDYPPDLSILISGGKENNRDSPSSGERTGKSPSPNPAAHFCVAARMGVVAYGPASLPGRT